MARIQVYSSFRLNLQPRFEIPRRRVKLLTIVRLGYQILYFPFEEHKNEENRSSTMTHTHVVAENETSSRTTDRLFI